MKGSEITTASVANKIAELIVSQNYISKDDLIPKIDAYLKAFVKQQSMPKLMPADLKQENILLQKQMNFVLNEQQRYLGSELCKLVGRDNMKVHNDKMVEIRESYGC
jgi:hypothetical protein